MKTRIKLCLWIVVAGVVAITVIASNHARDTYYDELDKWYYAKVNQLPYP